MMPRLPRVWIPLAVALSASALGSLGCSGAPADAAASGTGAESTTSADPAAPPNFAQVRDGLYRGGHPSYDNLAYLKSLGVTTVVDLEIADYVEATPEEIQEELNDAVLLGLTVVREPLSAFQPFVNQQEMNDTLAVLAGSYVAPVSGDDDDDGGATTGASADAGSSSSSSTGGAIYVHCRHGQDRTGMVVGLERVLVEGWAPHDAYQEMLAYGFHTYFLGLKEYFFDQTDYDGS